MPVRHAWALVVLVCGIAGGVAFGGTDFDMMDTQNAETLKLGEFRTTIGGRWHEQPDDSHILNAPRVGFDAGIGPWAEFTLRYDLRTLYGSEQFADTTRSGDPILMVKGIPWEFWGLKAGASFAMKVPSGKNDPGVGSNQVDFFGRLIVGHQFDHLRLSLNLGAAVLGDNSRAFGSHGLLLYGFHAEYELCEEWNLFAEFRGAVGAGRGKQIAQQYPGDDFSEARLGVQGPLAGGWTWSLDGTVGTNPASPDWSTTLTFSHVWGKADTDFAGNYRSLDRVDSNVEPVRLAVYDPLVTETADTVNPKQMRFTADFGATEQNDDSHLYWLPRLSGSFGIGPWADFALEDQVQYLKSGENTFGDQFGLGSLFGRLKMTPLRGDCWRAGVAFGGKLPIGDHRDGLSSGRLDVFGKVIGSVRLGDLRLHANVGVAVNDHTNHSGGGQEDYLLFGVAGEYPLCQDITVVAEVAGSTLRIPNRNVSIGWAGDDNTQVRAGFIGPFPLATGWQWGVVGAAGVSADAPDWQVLLGFSTVFGDADPAK